MFSLVVSVIAIALVAALVAASLYYGGSAFNSSVPRTTATRHLNDLSQVKAAVELYRADRTQFPVDVQQLLDTEYLQARPDRLVFFEPDYVVTPTPDAEICLAYNRMFNLEGIPACDSPEVAGAGRISLCCSTQEDAQ